MTTWAENFRKFPKIGAHGNSWFWEYLIGLSEFDGARSHKTL